MAQPWEGTCQKSNFLESSSPEDRSILGGPGRGRRLNVCLSQQNQLISNPDQVTHLVERGVVDPGFLLIYAIIDGGARRIGQMVNKAEFSLCLFRDHTKGGNPQIAEQACHTLQIQLLLKLLVPQTEQRISN